jgi:hypothetical protein
MTHRKLGDRKFWELEVMEPRTGTREDRHTNPETTKKKMIKDKFAY